MGKPEEDRKALTSFSSPDQIQIGKELQMFATIAQDQMKGNTIIFFPILFESLVIAFFKVTFTTPSGGFCLWGG
jgi:hypothetical protein